MSIETSNQNLALASTSAPLATLDEAPVSLRVNAEEIALALSAPDSASSGAIPRLDSLWHRVVEKPHLDVVLRSHLETSQLVHLRVQSAARGWKNTWPQWSWPVRFVSEDLGGDAASAQDVTHDDGSVSLLLLPNERREIELSFDLPLEEARAGDYAVLLILSRDENATTSTSRRTKKAETVAIGPLPAAEIADNVPQIDPQIKAVVETENPTSVEQVRAEEAETAWLEHDGAGVARVLVGEAVRHEIEIARAPVLVKLRHPQARWMNYLPGIYQSSPVDEIERELFGYRETPFFERFLRGFEDGMAPLQVLVGNLEQFFGADSTPPDFLPWLATWAGLALDENWPQLKRRRLIHQALELYRWRGTRRGLKDYLEIYCDVRPQIHDQPFSGMKLGPKTRLGHDTTIGHIAPHTFIVTIGVERPEAVNLQTVQQIIDSQKPAHTAYEVRIVPQSAAPEEVTAPEIALARDASADNESAEPDAASTQHKLNERM